MISTSRMELQQTKTRPKPGEGVLQGILGGGVAPGSSNPDPISDQRKKRRKEKEKKNVICIPRSIIGLLGKVHLI